MNLRDYMLAFSVPINWGLGFAFAKAGLSEFPPLFLMGMRFSLAALILVWFVSLPKGNFQKVFWIALVGSTIQYGLTFTGLTMIDASLAVIVIQLEVPFGVLLAAVVLREKPGLQRIVGMLLAFSGVAVLAGQPSLQGQIFAIVITGSGALMWAVGQIMVKQLGTDVDSFSLVAWVGVFSGPQMIIGSFLLEDNQWVAIQQATWIGWGTVIYLGVIMTALGYGIWYRVLSRNPVSQVMPVLLTLPVTTMLASIFLLGERPTIGMLTGGTVVLVGLAVIVFKREHTALKEKLS